MTHRTRHRLLVTVVALLAVVGFAGAPPASAAEPDVGNFTSLAYDHSSDGGYWTQVDGKGVESWNGAATFGAGPKRNATIVANPVGTGYWLVERNGHVSSFGEARSLGSFPDKEIYVPGIHLYISGGIDTATVTPSGKGLYGVDSLGGVHTLGDARSLGDVKKDIGGSYPVGVVSRMNPQTGTVGYWIADSGGGVYSFGLPFHGSMGRNSFIINGMTGTVGGDGYCIMDYGGYLSAFGDAAASGCANVADYHQDFVGIALKPGGGYALIKENGAVTIASGSRSGSQQAPWWCLWSGVCRPQTTSSVPRVKES